MKKIIAVVLIALNIAACGKVHKIKSEEVPKFVPFDEFVAQLKKEEEIKSVEQVLAQEAVEEAKAAEEVKPVEIEYDDSNPNDSSIAAYLGWEVAHNGRYYANKLKSWNTWKTWTAIASVSLAAVTVYFGYQNGYVTHRDIYKNDMHRSKIKTTYHFDFLWLYTHQIPQLAKSAGRAVMGVVLYPFRYFYENGKKQGYANGYTEGYSKSTNAPYNQNHFYKKGYEDGRIDEARESGTYFDMEKAEKAAYRNGYNAAVDRFGGDNKNAPAGKENTIRKLRNVIKIQAEQLDEMKDMMGRYYNLDDLTPAQKAAIKNIVRGVAA